MTRLRRAGGVVLLAVLVAGCSTTASLPVAAPSSSSAPAETTVSPTSARSSPSPLPTLPPSIPLASLHGRILFTRAGHAYLDETVFTALADGTAERRLTKPGESCCPRFSPDGRQILISGLSPDGRITTAIITVDGSPVRLIPLPRSGLNLGPGPWSPDGKRIAFDGFNDADPSISGIYVGSATGGDIVRVTTTREQPMDFTADGKRLIYFESVAGFPTIGDQLSGSLFEIGIDGKGRRQLTSASLPIDWIGGEPGRLSPDGTSIVVASEGAVWVLGSDGSMATKVFDDPDGRIAINPTWSPDGQLILFGLDPSGSLATLDSAPQNVLAIVRADGTDLTTIVSTPDWKRGPEWRTTNPG